MKTKNIHIKALESARHELVTLNGLIATDGASQNQKWTVNTTDAIKQIDEALAIQPSESCNQPS